MCVCGERHSYLEDNDMDEPEEWGLPPLCSCGLRHSDGEWVENEDEDEADLPPRCTCGLRHGYDDEDGGPHAHMTSGGDAYGFVPWSPELGLSAEDVLHAVGSSLGVEVGALRGGGGGIPAFVVPPYFPFGPVMLDSTGMADFLRGGMDDPEPPLRGLSPEMIERLAPAQSWPPSSAPSAEAGTPPNAAADANIADDDCAVCQEGLRGTALVRKFPCKHIFHAACADQWLCGAVTCPSCRRDFSATDGGGAGGGSGGGGGRNSE